MVRRLTAGLLLYLAPVLLGFAACVIDALMRIL